MNKKVINILVIILLLICTSIVIFSIVNKKDDNNIENNDGNDNQTIVIDDDKNIINTFSNEITFNQVEHTIKINYYKDKEKDKLHYEILIDENIVVQSSDIEDIVFPSEDDIFLINGSDEKEYLIIKIHEEDEIEKIYVVNETNLLGELDFDLSFQIGNLEGENKELYYISENLYSQFVIEENDIRYLLVEDCESSKDTYNFIENVLSINDNKIVVEKRSTHVGNNFTNGNNLCNDSFKIIIY